MTIREGTDDYSGSLSRVGPPTLGPSRKIYPEGRRSLRYVVFVLPWEGTQGTLTKRGGLMDTRSCLYLIQTVFLHRISRHFSTRTYLLSVDVVRRKITLRV